MTTPHELTVPVDDFQVLRQPLFASPLPEMIAERDRLTAEVLDRITTPPRRGRLSGTFLYAHPPDYRGRPTLHYTVDDWRSLLQELKELGLDTVIFNASAWVDLRECYYPSDLLRDFRTWNVVEPMLEAVRAEKLTLFLGGVGIVRTPDELGLTTNDPSRAAAAAARELACYRELRARYGGTFQGYYLATETGYWHDQPDHAGACWHTFLERVTNGVKELNPALPILTSPCTTYARGYEQPARDYLTRLHANCPIDIIAPQDSIGTFNNLSFLEAGLTVWREVCASLGAAFWVNCESFSIRRYDPPLVTIVPAEFKRFAVQLDTAAGLGAQRLVTWEAMYFLARGGDEAARRLRESYLARRKDPPQHVGQAGAVDPR